MLLAFEKLLKTPNEHHNLKWLIRQIQSLDKYKSIRFLQKIDLFVYGYKGIDIGKSSDETRGLMVKLQIPYLLEKVISFSNGTKKIYFDAPYLHHMGIPYNKKIMYYFHLFTIVSII